MNSATATRIAQLRTACENSPHGTRARYISGCKCVPCRAANSRYSSQSAARCRAGQVNDLVTTDAARAHLATLSKVNVGYRSVADAAGVSRSIIAKVLNGAKTHIRRDTEIRILAVDAQAIGDNALVPAGPTWKILNGLIDEGYTKRQLAEWLGCSRSIQYRRDWITARTAARVEKMTRLLAEGKLRRIR